MYEEVSLFAVDDVAFELFFDGEVVVGALGHAG